MTNESKKSSWWSWPSSSSDGPNAEETPQPSRFEHDIKQALSMQSKPSFRSASSAPAGTSKQRSLVDANLALKGIAQADVYKQRGKLIEALKLYELSIDLILRILRDPHAFQSNEVHRKKLEARAASALSVAEEVKATIKNKPQTTPQNSPRDSAEQGSPDTFQAMSKALESAIAVPVQRKITKAASARTISTIPAKPSISTRPAQQRPRPGNLKNTAAVAKTKTDTSNSSQLREMVMSDFYVQTSTLQKTTWKDISGLDNVKQSLQESAILPLMRPDLFSGLRKPQNILLWGPPGTGKTMLVRATAHESKCSLFMVTAGTLTSKWMGEAEKLVRELFTVARELSPTIIFIDEVDSLLSIRKSDGEHEASRRLKTEVMVQMDGISTKTTNDRGSILVLACTNCPWDIDPAVLRRFPRRIYVPLPDAEARKGLLRNLLRKAGKHSLTARQVTLLTKRLEGYSCSDIAEIASEASFGPLRTIGTLEDICTVSASDIPPLSMKDFDEAINQSTPSVSAIQIQRFDDWQQKLSPST